MITVLSSASPASAASATTGARALTLSGGARAGLLAVVLIGLIVIPAVAAVDILVRRRRRAEAPAGPYAEEVTGPILPRIEVAAGARRGPARRGQAPAVAPDAMGGWAVDRVLRVIATACHESGRPFPALSVVMVDPEKVVLRLAVPDDRPAEPWSAGESGRVWTAGFLALQAAPVDLAVPLPTLRMVTLGVAGDTRVLIDLEQCHGLVAVDGPKAAVRALAVTWLNELAGASWSVRVPLIAAGFGSEAPASAVVTRDPATALIEMGPADGSREPGVLFLAGPPSGKVAGRLAELVMAPGRGGWSAVCLGTVAASRWAFTLHPDGRLDTGALGIVVRAPLE